MNISTLNLWTSLLAFGLTGSVAGQTADGSSNKPLTSEKFIFYWGDNQATLTATNEYRAEWVLRPQAFQQMLLRTPYLWNGRAMADRVTFRLDRLPVAATRNGHDYEASVVELYEHFSEKITRGQHLTITDLALTSELVGAIDIRLEEVDSSTFIAAEHYPVSWLDENAITAVQWGLQHHKIHERDFFTPREALEILRQQPVIEWQPYSLPLPVYVDVQITQGSGVQHGLRILLSDSEAYQQIIRYSEQYRFLLRPNAHVILSLYSNQYDRLFAHKLRLVNDNDPRLALRRRDAHQARLQWGPINHKWKNVYLTHFEDANGTTLHADLPYVVHSSLARAKLLDVFTSRPTLWIDDVLITDLAFSISINGTTDRVLPGTPLPRLPIPEDNNLCTVHLHDLEAAGYDLSGLAAAVTFIPIQVLRLPIDEAPQTPSALTLYLPALTSEAVKIAFYLPEATTLSLVVKDKHKAAIHIIQRLYSAGQHSTLLPKHLFPTPGPYVIVLKAPYGQVEQSVDIP